MDGDRIPFSVRLRSNTTTPIRYSSRPGSSAAQPLGISGARRPLGSDKRSDIEARGLSGRGECAIPRDHHDGVVVMTITDARGTVRHDLGREGDVREGPPDHLTHRIHRCSCTSNGPEVEDGPSNYPARVSTLSKRGSILRLWAGDGVHVGSPIHGRSMSFGMWPFQRDVPPRHQRSSNSGPPSAPSYRSSLSCCSSSKRRSAAAAQPPPSLQASSRR